jgi:hypothetical protein
MNGMRKVLNVLVIAVAALALPASAAKPPQAQDKSYSVEFLLPSKAANGIQDNPLYLLNPDVPGDKEIQPPVTVVVYVKNESPPSTAASNIGSLSFDLAPSLVLVAAPSCPNAQCTVNGNTVTVSNISPPIQGRQVYPVTLQVNSCVVANEAFITNVNVFTGSQVFNGQPFSAFVNDATFQYSKVLSTRGTAYPIDFTTTVAPTVTGISCGNIACGQSFSIGNLDPTSQDYKLVTGFRGLNADGTCSLTSHLSYFVTNKLGVAVDSVLPRSVHFVFPSDATTTPVFAYKMTSDVNATESPALTLGWLPKTDTAVQLDAANLHCNVFYSPTEPEPTLAQLPLPMAYGLLTQDVKANTKQLKVDTGSNAPPTVTSPGLPIMVENERMLVTSIDNSGWSVTRTNPVAHLAGRTVASTPMPLLDTSVGQYVAGTPAKMCLVWTDGTSAWVIDGSDGWTKFTP